MSNNVEITSSEVDTLMEQLAVGKRKSPRKPPKDKNTENNEDRLRKRTIAKGGTKKHHPRDRENKDIEQLMREINISTEETDTDNVHKRDTTKKARPKRDKKHTKTKGSSEMSSNWDPMPSSNTDNDDQDGDGGKGTLSLLEKLILGLVNPELVDDEEILREFLAWGHANLDPKMGKKALQADAKKHMLRPDPEGTHLRADAMRLSSERYALDGDTLAPVYEKALTNQVEVMRRQITLFHSEFKKKVATIDLLLQDKQYTGTRRDRLKKCRTLLQDFLEESSNVGVLTSTTEGPLVGGGKTLGRQRRQRASSSKSISGGGLLLGALATAGTAYAGYKLSQQDGIRIFFRSIVEYSKKKLSKEYTARQVTDWKAWLAAKETIHRTDDPTPTPEKIIEEIQNYYQDAPDKEALLEFANNKTGILSAILRAKAPFTKAFRYVLRKIPVTINGYSIVPRGTEIATGRVLCTSMIDTASGVSTVMMALLKPFTKPYIKTMISTPPELVRNHYLNYLVNKTPDKASQEANVRWYLTVLDWFWAAPTEVREKMIQAKDSEEKGSTFSGFNQERTTCEWILTFPVPTSQGPKTSAKADEYFNSIRESAKGKDSPLLTRFVEYLDAKKSTIASSAESSLT